MRYLESRPTTTTTTSLQSQPSTQADQNQRWHALPYLTLSSLPHHLPKYFFIVRSIRRPPPTPSTIRSANPISPADSSLISRAALLFAILMPPLFLDRSPVCATRSLHARAHVRRPGPCAWLAEWVVIDIRSRGRGSRRTSPRDLLGIRGRKNLTGGMVGVESPFFLPFPFFHICSIIDEGYFPFLANKQQSFPTLDVSQILSFFFF